MNFNDPETRRTYSGRSVNENWLRWCQKTLSPADKDVVEIGCGGGIYSRGFASLNAKSVIGIDHSSQYLKEARKESESHYNLSFLQGTASDTGLKDECVDIVYLRAVIHHLDQKEQASNAKEIWRILKPGGICAIQDRTMADVVADHPDYWIRSTLFETFPRLLEFEQVRRIDSTDYLSILKKAGFEKSKVETSAELRKSYPTFSELESEIMERKGKSILFELSDQELKAYCERLKSKAGTNHLKEIDQWTIWTTKKASV